MSHEEVRYAGFWLRTWAALLDSFCLTALLLPAALLIYGAAYFSPRGGWFRGPVDFFLQIVFPFLLVYWFWRRWLATPGKMLLSSKIVDARTGQAPSPTQLLIRYFGYFVSLFPLGLGFVWIALDARKQGWHDKLARTVVVITGEAGRSRRLKRTLAWVTGVSLALLLAGTFACGFWLWRQSGSLAASWEDAETAQQDGVLFGIGIPARLCVPEALRRLDACQGFFCGYRSSLFLGGCLPASEKTVEFCRDIPGGLGVLASAQWPRERCSQLGRPSWSCWQVLTVPVIFCRRRPAPPADAGSTPGFVH